MLTERGQGCRPAGGENAGAGGDLGTPTHCGGLSSEHQKPTLWKLACLLLFVFSINFPLHFL